MDDVWGEVRDALKDPGAEPKGHGQVLVEGEPKAATENNQQGSMKGEKAKASLLDRVCSVRREEQSEKNQMSPPKMSPASAGLGYCKGSNTPDITFWVRGALL